MISRSFTINAPMGAHLRLSAAIVRLMKDYRSHVTLQCGSVVSHARSMTGLLILGACHGREVTVAADGPDEAAALAAIGRLLEEPAGSISRS